MCRIFLPVHFLKNTSRYYYQHPRWLFTFDEASVSSCNLLNVCLKNWPDRDNKASVFISDMFTTTEDETIAVVS